MIGDANLFNILLSVLIAVTVASRGFRVDEDYIASWSRWFNLEVTQENRPTVRRYLQWTRRCRTAGGLAGFLAPTFYFELVNPGHVPDDVGGWAMTLTFVGYLLGALLAEVVIDPYRRHSPVPIRLVDHLPTYAVVLQRGLAFASVFLVGIYALLEPSARISGLPDVRQVAGLGLAAACLALVVEGFQRKIIVRARPASEDVGVETAMKSSSLYVLAGGGIALLGGIAGPMFILSVVTVTAEAGPPAWVALVAFGLVMLSSLYFWLYFGKPGGFGVRQGERQRVAS